MLFQYVKTIFRHFLYITGRLDNNGMEFVAHRGYAAHYPENTILSFQKAIEAGCLFLECDVQLSVDHVPVIIHDDTIDRTSGKSGSVMEMTAEELSRVNVGEPSRFGNEFTITPLPKLAEIIPLLHSYPDVKIFVELKEESLHHFGIDLMVGKVLEVLKPVKNRCLIISFDYASLESVREHGWNEIGWVLEKWNKESLNKANSLLPSYLICDYKVIPPNKGNIWIGPWEWFLYEITDIDTALLWNKLGVRYIETMESGEMIEKLKRKKG